MSKEKEFLHKLETFRQKYGEDAACQIMSAMIDERLESKREERRKLALGNYYDEMKDLKVEHEISAGGDILDATVIE
jgi:hypothetical protein